MGGPDGAAPVLELQLRPEPTAASEARAAIRRALAESVDPVVIDDLVLVATELVSNSVMHAGLRAEERIDVRLWADGRLRLEVEDRGRGFARSAADPPLRPGEAGGRGLFIVASLSDRWALVEEGSVRIWAELPLRPREAADPS